MLKLDTALTISTAHLTEFDALHAPELGGVHFKGDYGIFVHTSGVFLSENTAFTSLRECVYFARRHDIALLIFDRDATTIDELPTYEW